MLQVYHTLYPAVNTHSNLVCNPFVGFAVALQVNVYLGPLVALQNPLQLQGTPGKPTDKPIGHYSEGYRKLCNSDLRT